MTLFPCCDCCDPEWCESHADQHTRPCITHQRGAAVIAEWQRIGWVADG